MLKEGSPAMTARNAILLFSGKKPVRPFSLRMTVLFLTAGLLSTGSAFSMNVKGDMFSKGGEKYAKEYLRVLDENESDLLTPVSGAEASEDAASEDSSVQPQNEDVSQTQYTDENGRLIHTVISPAALIDVCADPTPELLFITKQVQADPDSGPDVMSGPVLHVYTYNGFNCEEVLSQTLENIGGYASWCLFQASGQKNLWVYTCTGYSQKKCTYTNYSLKQDAFQIDRYLLRNPPQGSALPVCLDTDVQISEETWRSEESELMPQISSIIQWNSIEAENQGLMNQVASLYQGSASLAEIKDTLKKLAGESE